MATFGRRPSSSSPHTRKRKLGTPSSTRMPVLIQRQLCKRPICGQMQARLKERLRRATSMHACEIAQVKNYAQHYIWQLVDMHDRETRGYLEQIQELEAANQELRAATSTTIKEKTRISNNRPIKLAVAAITNPDPILLECDVEGTSPTIKTPEAIPRLQPRRKCRQRKFQSGSKTGASQDIRTSMSPSRANATGTPTGAARISGGSKTYYDAFYPHVVRDGQIRRRRW